nr:MAG TPA_asm: hypothetical protein [Caudoviricetes sp.]
MRTVLLPSIFMLIFILISCKKKSRSINDRQ